MVSQPVTVGQSVDFGIGVKSPHVSRVSFKTRTCLAGKAWNGWYPPPGYEQSNISNRTLKNAVVTCGKPPSTAPDCSKSSGPCLFDIEQDPCEYVNLASQHEDLVQKLLTKLEEYRNSSVPPRNKHMDPRANPKYHGGAWVPWEDLP